MKPDTVEILRRVEDSIDLFYKAMQTREQLSIRIGRRTTLLVRFTMVATLVLGIVLFYLVNALTRQMDEISARMGEVVAHMEAMNRNVGVMPAMNGAVRGMGREMVAIRESLGTVVATMRSIDGNMDVMPVISADMQDIDLHMSRLNRQFEVMNASMGRMNYSMDAMNHDVNRIARPMSMIPFFGQ